MQDNFSDVPPAYNLIVFDNVSYEKNNGGISQFHTGLNNVQDFPSNYIRLLSYKTPNSNPLDHTPVTTFRFATITPNSIICAPINTIMSIGFIRTPSFMMYTNEVMLSDPMPVWTDEYMCRLIISNKADDYVLAQLPQYVSRMENVVHGWAIGDNNSVVPFNRMSRHCYDIISMYPNIYNWGARGRVANDKLMSHVYRNNMCSYNLSTEREFVLQKEEELRLVLRLPWLFHAKYIRRLPADPFVAKLQNSGLIIKEQCIIDKLNEHMDDPMNILLSLGVIALSCLGTAHLEFMCNRINMDKLYLGTPIMLQFHTPGHTVSRIETCIDKFEPTVLKYLTAGIYNVRYVQHYKKVHKFNTPTPYHELCHRILQKHPECWQYVTDLPTYMKYYVLPLAHMCAYFVNTVIPVVYFVESIVLS